WGSRSACQRCGGRSRIAWSTATAIACGGLRPAPWRTPATPCPREPSRAKVPASAPDRGAARSSIYADAARLDRGGPFLGFARHEFLQIISRPAVGGDNRHADLFQPFLHRGCVHGRDRRIVKLLDDRCGRALGQEEAAPEIGIEID